ECDQSPAPLRRRGRLPVTGRTLRVGLGLRMRLLRRLALCVGLTAMRVGRLGRLDVRVGLLAGWVRRLARLLRLPWLLAPTGIRLRPELRGPLAAGLVVDVPLIVISAPGKIRTHPQLQIDHAILQRKSRRKLLLHYQLNIS